MTCRIISFSLKSFLVNQSRPASYRQFQNVGSLFSATNHSSSSAAYSARPIVLAQFNSLRSFHSSSSRCSDGGRHDNEIPPLMGQVRRIIVPNLFKSIGNFFQTILIIKPYFDSDFTLTEFIQGTKQAIQVISRHLAAGDTDSLEGLVDREALQEIKTNLCFFSLEQRKMLAISAEDIFFAFPYKVGIIMNDNDRGVQERFVEITVGCHAVPGYGEQSRNSEDFQLSPDYLKRHRERLVVCNYRFIREFTKGVQGQWIVNLVNHFRLPDDGGL